MSRWRLQKGWLSYKKADVTPLKSNKHLTPEKSKLIMPGKPNKPESVEAFRGDAIKSPALRICGRDYGLVVGDIVSVELKGLVFEGIPNF
jgi:hypothetical protein